MQLTLYTDYSLRVLVYLSLKHGKTVTITELADFYKISRNHLVKVVHNLASKNFITTIRGKNGGMQLTRNPESITIGNVVRVTEPNFHMVECFDRPSNHCAITPVCALKSVLHQATQQFLEMLDRYTLADAVSNKALVSNLVRPKVSLDRDETQQAGHPTEATKK